eukprot:CAMPEP_0202713270 /NCGR_PEP_ID=MMETSP1385-20130828/52467_1 /ASSEMBLY_ACC=CAM_ASM_000861 /TAXON_ID=933848 /ORGANISM="Elphidium margaritaceum" /LENGTH=393 /DNA_ID=CAMNT_0049373565 /DNA_START=152 /DNA_END=1333 /DNA_ORIENTATION=+
MSTTTQSTEEDDFFAMNTIEIAILGGVAIGCALFVGILCCYQKNKTKKFEQQRQRETDELFADVERKRQHKMAQMRRQQSMQQNLLQQQQQSQRQPQQRPLAKSVAVTRHHPHAAGGGDSTTGASTPRDRGRIASVNGARPLAQSLLHSAEDAPPPPPPASAPPADVIELAQRREQRKVVPAPPAAAARDDTAPAHAFKKVLSVPDALGATAPLPESALTLPDVERDSRSAAPPQSVPAPKMFDAATGSPMRPDDDSLPRKISIAIADDEEGDGGTEQQGDVDESAAMHVHKASMMTAIVHDEEKSEDEEEVDGSASASSSSDANDRHLLAIAHQQMESKPPPSLQTIFQRNVQRDEDGKLQRDSDSDDSLMQRQQQFIENPEKMESNLRFHT